MKVSKLQTRPNILIINSDQQRFDTLSCYGNNWIKTPNLNSLAKDSFVFENAYVTQPVCAPSRASILTGLYPHTHGAVGNGIRLNSGTKTITELIPDDYQKICHGKWHHTEPQQGFEKMTTAHFPQIEGNDYSDLSDYHKWLISKGVNFPDTDKVEENQQIFAVFQNNLPEELTQASFISEITSKEILDIKENTKPFLLLANFYEPHSPFTGPLNGLYDPEKIPVGPAFAKKPENVSHYNTSRAEDDETGFNKSFIDGVHKSVHVNDSITSCDDCYDLSNELGWRELRANYMANVTLLDKYVGKVLDALSESGQSENTIVVFTSDHGDMLGDHRHLQKRSFYEESSKVPLLIKVPWISKEQKFVSGNISLVDLLPTLLDLIDQKIPENLQGASKKKVLLGQENLDDNDVFYEWNGVGNIDLNKQTIGVTQDDKSGISSTSRRCIVSSDRWKLTVSPNDSSELFDLNNDPSELINKISDPSCKSRIELMENKIKKWQIQTEDTEKILD